MKNVAHSDFFTLLRLISFQMKKTFSIDCRLLPFLFFILHSSFFISLGAQNLQKGDHYLYCHMNGGVAWTAYAISPDGIHFHDLIDGDSIFSDAEVATIARTLLAIKSF